MGVQMYSPTGQYDIKGMAAKMIKKYEPVLRWGIRPLPGFPEETFGQAPFGFVTPPLNQDIINQIEVWEPGQPIDNSKKLASDFLNLLARSVDPDIREQFLKVSLLDPQSKIPKSLASQALLDTRRLRLTLASYSRSLGDLSRRLQA